MIVIGVICESVEEAEVGTKTAEVETKTFRSRLQQGNFKISYLI